MSKTIPTFEGKLRSSMLKIPKEIYACSGISIFGRRIKSILFSTDVSIIRNTNADAVIAVYPFTPQPIITRAIMTAADVPVFCGVGGGLTAGERSVSIAVEAELQGVIGVVLNAPTSNETIRKIAEKVDIPIVVTVVKDDEDFKARLDAGVSIFNVSAAAKTPELIRKIRKEFPEVAIIATGGPTAESITATVEAGANAITWTPPTTGEILTGIMSSYRKGENNHQ